MSDRSRGSAGRPEGPVQRTEAGVRERIRLLIELNRPQDGLSLARKAYASGDHGSDLAELEGLALIRLGEHAAALEALQRGLKQTPERPHLHYLWSFGARSAGRTEDSKRAIAEALRLAPEEPVYLRAQAELLSEERDHTRALESAHAAVHHGPERAASWVTLGFVASNAGDKPLARRSYEKALLLDPQEASAWNNLGCLDLADGKARLARERFREALRLQPEGQRARRNLEQTLTGQTLEGFVVFDDVVRALAEELAAAARTRILLALAMEADAARAALRAALTQPGAIRAQAALGAVGVGIAWGFIAASPMPRLLGAGVGLLASAGARRWLDAECRRVRAQLADARDAFGQLRRDWLDGKLERAGRDLAARRIVERSVVALCGEEIPPIDPSANPSGGSGEKA